MTLDAKALYEIVKDVLVEAWPDRLRFQPLNREWVIGVFPMWTYHAELMFEASMARWLEGGCCHRTKSGWCYHDNHSAFGDDGESALSIVGNTRVEALALACKAVKP